MLHGTARAMPFFLEPRECLLCKLRNDSLQIFDTPIRSTSHAAMELMKSHPRRARTSILHWPSLQLAVAMAWSRARRSTKSESRGHLDDAVP